MALALGAQALTASQSEAADDRSAVAQQASDIKFDSSDARLQQLIKQLGSPQYTVRRAAASEIHKIGPEAFDRLHAATEDADPEIAASAGYLLRQIAVRWTRSDDSVLVRRLLRGYSDRDDADRQRIIQMLAGLPEGEGVAGLCRVARFDRSPLLSRLAAMAIIQSDNESAGQAPASVPIDQEIIDRELGESTREASRWLRQFQIQLRDPAASVAGWQHLIDEEAKRIDTEFDQTSPAIVSALWWNLADVHRRLGETGPLVDVSDRLLAVGSSDSESFLGTFLQWLVQHESWDAVEQFAAKHTARIEKSKRTLYLLAMARTKQDQREAAEEVAQRAAKLAPTKPLDGLEAAQLLVALGQFDWAVREYQVGIEGQPIEAVSTIGARMLLSNLLQDYERYDEGADAIAPLVEAMEQNPDVERAYASAQGELDFLPKGEVLVARLHFLRACHFEQEHDFKSQREELLEAIKHDETDADVLIAMYRVGDADDAWTADTRKRIRKLSKEIEDQIDDRPEEPIYYNQWAWLIANTEGDFPKAVRLSRRSLELAPGTASFLDTLGRCYFSAGDIKNAVKSQREAVAVIPHMQVMQRQLRQFEQALAEQQGSEVGGRRSEKVN